MRPRFIVRAAATGLLVLLIAVPASQEVAGANDVPPPSPTTTIPAPPVNGQGNVKACELAYTQVRAELLSEFRAAIVAGAKANDIIGIADAADTYVQGLAGLNAGFGDCLTRVLPTGGVRAAALSAKPKHRGGGGGSGSSCLATFDKAVKNAARAEDRSFRKKHHTVSPEVASATYNAAATTAARQLQSCLGA